MSHVTPNLYVYAIEVVSVYDGDTIRANIDLGFNIVQRNEPIRLLGIDTPEVRGSEREAGLAARDYLRSILLPSPEGLVLHSYKDKSGKYGRILGRLQLADGRYINDMLMEAGHAKPYDK